MLHAVEPTSGKDLDMQVRISVLSAEQVDEAMVDHARPVHQHL